MSDAVGTFTLVPPVREYETPQSFVSRLSAYNCLDSVHDLYRFVGAKSGRAHTASSHARILKMAGVAASSFAEAQGARRNSVLLNGHEVRAAQLCRQLPRYCPVCVSEDVATGNGPVGARSFQRFWWQWTLIEACDRHGCNLVTGEQEIAGSMPDFARYVADNFGKIQTEASAAKFGAVHAVDSYLLDRLMARPTAVPGVLDRVPLKVAVKFCEGLGRFLEHGRAFNNAANREHHRLEVGFALVSQGEAEMFRALNERASRRWRARGVRKTTKYGSLYVMLNEHVGDPKWQPLIEIFRRDGFETLQLSDGEVFLGVVSSRPINSVDSISLMYDISRSEVREILEECQLLPRRGGGVEGETPPFLSYDMDTIEAAFGWIRSALNIKAAGLTLGLNRGQLLAFGTAGVLRTVRLGQNAGLAWHFSKESVERVLQEIAALDPVHETTREYCSLVNAKNQSGSGPADLWAGVRDGSINAVRRLDLSGLRSVYVSRLEARGTRLARVKKASRSEG
ncbi:TniQ protein [Rhizobium sp. PP-F2F-G38]|nr:TniQ protein [Rhizobium sp. PP-F2F-G38]